MIAVISELWDTNQDILQVDEFNGFQSASALKKASNITDVQKHSELGYECILNGDTLLHVEFTKRLHPSTRDLVTVCEIINATK